MNEQLLKIMLEMEALKSDREMFVTANKCAEYNNEQPRYGTDVFMYNAQDFRNLIMDVDNIINNTVKEQCF
jgi:hypothetical protein